MTRRVANVFLIGFMGAGKTSVGQLLAAALSCGFVDLDRRVEERAGRSVAAIFRESGEERFRRLEWEALCSLDRATRQIVATGGGTPMLAAARRRMWECGVGVWLDLPLEEVVRRVGTKPDRPLWDGDDRLGLRALLERRRAVYALSAIRVPAHPGSPQQIAERVLGRIRPFFR